MLDTARHDDQQLPTTGHGGPSTSEGGAGAQLHETYGKAMSVADVAKFLSLDPRTVRSHAAKLGGIEVIPGTYRFFELRLKEILNAKLGDEERHPPLARVSHGQREAETPVVPGRHTRVQKGSNGLGTVGERSNGPLASGAGADPYNLLPA